MPTFMTEQIARALYARPQVYTRPVGAPYDPPPDHTYSREFYGDALDTLFTNRASGVTNLGVATSASILIVGSGFGWLMEALAGQGITDVYGIDPGDWYWDPTNDAEWAVGMKARTAQDWIGSGTEVASLQALGVSGQARFTFIVDEDAAPGHTDAELPAFIAGLEARLQGNARGRIIHLVSPEPGRDSSQNWKTMAEWEAVAPDHTWINIRSLS